MRDAGGDEVRQVAGERGPVGGESAVHRRVEDLAVPAVADGREHADPAAGTARTGVTGALQCLVGQLQEETGLGVRRPRLLVVHAEEGRVERGGVERGGVERGGGGGNAGVVGARGGGPGVVRAGAVGAGGAGPRAVEAVEAPGRFPAALRPPGDDVATGHEQVPEGFGRRRPGEPAGRREDGHGIAARHVARAPSSVRGISCRCVRASVPVSCRCRPRTEQAQHMSREGRDGVVVHHGPGLHGDAEGLLHGDDDGHRLERGATEREEPVVRTDGVRRELQRPRPDAEDGLLDGTARTRSTGCVAGRGARSAGIVGGHHRPLAHSRFHGRVRPRLEAVAQQAAPQLPAGGAGKAAGRQGKHPYVVVSQCLPQPGGRRAQHGGGGGCGTGPLDEAHDALRSGGRFGGPDDRDRARGQSGRPGEGLLQVRSVERTTVDEDDVLVAAGDAQPALVQEAQVTGAEPAPGESGGGRVGVTVVAPAELGSPHLHVADPPVVQPPARAVGDADLAPGDGASQVHQLHGVRAGPGGLGAAPAERRPVQGQRGGHLAERGERHGEGRLGQPVHGERGPRVQPGGPGLRRELPPHAGADGFRTHQQQPHVAQVQRRDVAVRNPLHRQAQREVRGREDGRAVPGCRLQPQRGALGEAERLQPHLLQPRGHGRQVRADEPHVVEVGHPAEDHVLIGERRRSADLREVGQDARVGQLDALGRTGAAGGELEERDVVRSGTRQPPGRTAVAEVLEPQGAYLPGEVAQQRLVRFPGCPTDEEGGPAEVFVHRRHTVADRGQRHGYQTRRQRAPEHGLEVLAPLRDQGQRRAGRQPGVDQPARDPQRLGPQFGEGDGPLGAVAAHVHDDLLRRLLGRPQQDVQEVRFTVRGLHRQTLTRSAARPRRHGAGSPARRGRYAGGVRTPCSNAP